jgi:hypothetical protein
MMILRIYLALCLVILVFIFFPSPRRSSNLEDNLDFVINQFKGQYRCEKINILIDEQPNEIMKVYVKCKENQLKETTEKSKGTSDLYVKITPSIDCLF